jgi:hypothetical protein
MLWLLITIPCFSAGGIMAPGILTQMSVILTGGLLLGWKGGLVIGLLTIGVDFGMVYLEVAGKLTTMVTHNPFTRWIGAMIPFGSILILQYYTTNHLHISLITLKQEIKRRKEAESIKDKTFYNLGERVKELQTLYAVSRILQNENTSLEIMFQEITNVLPSGWQYPDITAARVCISDQEYTTENFRSSEFNQLVEMTTKTGKKVTIEVVYLQQMPESDEGPFLKDERFLINSITEIVVNAVERKNIENLNKEQAATFKAIIENTKESIYLISPKATGIVMCSACWEGLGVAGACRRLRVLPEPPAAGLRG